MDKRRECANCIWGEQCSDINDVAETDSINTKKECCKCDTKNRVCDYYSGYYGDMANLVHYIKELKRNTAEYYRNIEN